MSYINELKERIDTLKAIKDKEIENVLNEIVKKYDEMENQVIEYETSTQLGLGYELLQYGKILNVLYDCFDHDKGLEGLLKDIYNLYDYEIFENSGYVLKEFEDKIMYYLKKRNYVFGVALMDLTTYVEHTLIMDTILERANNLK